MSYGPEKSGAGSMFADHQRVTAYNESLGQRLDRHRFVRVVHPIHCPVMRKRRGGSSDRRQWLSPWAQSPHPSCRSKRDDQVPTVPSRLTVAVVVPSSSIESATIETDQGRRRRMPCCQRFPDRPLSLTKSVPPKSSKNNRQLAIAYRNARERRGDHFPSSVRQRILDSLDGHRHLLTADRPCHRHRPSPDTPRRAPPPKTSPTAGPPSLAPEHRRYDDLDCPNRPHRTATSHRCASPM